MITIVNILKIMRMNLGLIKTRFVINFWLCLLSLLLQIYIASWAEARLVGGIRVYL